MPILVQWKWQERTKSFLVIFHFTDDYSETNLRMETFYPFPGLPSPLKNTRMTWAPSHVEMALLSDILSYANLINGLKETEKEDLRDKLQGTRVKYEDTEAHIDEIGYVLQHFLEEVGLKCVICRPDPNSGEWQIFFELCPEYIDYLKNVLKPYLKS